jgi:hypothetical protein
LNRISQKCPSRKKPALDRLRPAHRPAKAGPASFRPALPRPPSSFARPAPAHLASHASTAQATSRHRASYRHRSYSRAPALSSQTPRARLDSYSGRSAPHLHCLL